MTLVSIYFKKGVRLNDKGIGMLDDVLTASKRNNDTEGQLENRLRAVFGVDGDTLRMFKKINLN